MGYWRISKVQQELLREMPIVGQPKFLLAGRSGHKGEPALQAACANSGIKPKKLGSRACAIFPAARKRRRCSGRNRIRDEYQPLVPGTPTYQSRGPMKH